MPFLTKKKKLQIAANTTNKAGDLADSLANLPQTAAAEAKQQRKEQLSNTGESKASGQTEVFRNEQGRLSGVTLPDGRTFLGLSPAEVNKIVEQQKQIKQTPDGAVEVGAQRKLERQQQAQVQTAGSVGLTPQQIALTQAGAQEAPIDKGQAISAGIANIVPSLIGGAAGGAAIGAIGGGGVGAIPGAAIGAVGGLLTGFFNGVRSNIKSQQSGQIQSTTKVLSSAKTNMRQLAILAAQDPANAPSYVEAYNQQLAQVYRAQAKLKLETAGNLNKFMDDGTTQLADFDLFIQAGGIADLYRQKLEVSLLSGVPPTFTAEDLAEFT